MARSQWPELGEAESSVLLDIADAAIVDGFAGRRPSVPRLAGLPDALGELRGVFVALTVDGELNGCIGTIVGVEPLGQGVARHSWAAAFADPRLPRLLPGQHPHLTIEVSVLSPLDPIGAESRDAVLDQLRPGVDGLVIAGGGGHGVFLPSVWEQLPEPTAFLDHLQHKAGLQHGWWPAHMRAWRFTATKYARRAGEAPSPSRAA